MRPSKNNFFEHVRWLRKAAEAQHAELILGGQSLEAYVRLGARHWVFYPQFFAAPNGVSCYTSTMSDDATHFSGWRPYKVKRWSIANDKLAFKRYATQAGLRIPEHSTDAEPAMQDVIVKRAASSFGKQVLGPFRSSAERAIDRAAGEYYERFIEGTLLKIWFWGARPICMEVDKMPTAVGDGQTTLQGLIEQRANLTKVRKEPEMRQFLANGELLAKYYGRELGEVLPAGTRQLIEFRYGTDLMSMSDRRVVDVGNAQADEWQYLQRVGTALIAAVPPDIRTHTVFTVDAVRDRENRVWLLEMNSNPTVHPLVYPVMMADMMQTSAESPPEAASARSSAKLAHS